ncbi:hypothetical protein JAAARDRAFT_37625 [Jaapia argillacea MUCL 33604]|uniref:Uncharacterized protein n=1 Tax=Jaapia argillacea MUCL 33604 TaxID=933084 RepID=A0A067PJY3_9AGAM|nr:hypothetical protein JAAARDRAFT_37625 [Jaapia argillacea MUCL 33604]
MSPYAPVRRQSSMDSEVSLSDFPSARRFKISSGRFSAHNFTKWIKSPEAYSDGVDQLSILSVAWGKTHKAPSHEYLVVTLRNSPSTLRLERDTDSWSTLWSPKSRSNCKDTVTIADRFLDLVGRNDMILASFAFKYPAAPLISLASLLEIISQQADRYNVWTFNCWWYAACLWRNLANRAERDDMCFQMNQEASEVRRLADREGFESWDALKFAQVLEFVHLAALERTWSQNSKAPKNHLGKASDDIELLFSQYSGHTEKGEVSSRDKLRVLIVSQSEPSKSAFLADAFQDVAVDLRDINQEIESVSCPNHIFHLVTTSGPLQGRNTQLVSQFIDERTDSECPHTERLDAVWYCKDIPVNKPCAFDEEDESILNTFRDVPVTIVFTGFGGLALRLKEQHLVRGGQDRAPSLTIGEETRKVFQATCMVPLKEICKNRQPGATTLKKVSVFYERGTRGDFYELVRTTRDSLHRHRVSRAADYSFKLCLLRKPDPDEAAAALNQGFGWRI